MRKGFTLIETLVVIAIILLMMSIGGNIVRYHIRAMENHQTQRWIDNLSVAREELMSSSLCGGDGFTEYPSLYAPIFDIDSTAANYQVYDINGTNQYIERFIDSIQKNRHRFDDSGPYFWTTWFENDETKWSLVDKDGNGYVEPIDSWGEAIRYEINHEITVRWGLKYITPTSFRFVSSGRDKVFNTDDDISSEGQVK